AARGAGPDQLEEIRIAMKRSFLFFVAGLLLLAATLLLAYRPQHVSLGQSAGPQFLKQVATIELPGPKGKRFDYLTIDPSRQLLFSTHLGAGLLYVIDLRTNKLVKTFEDLPGIEGVELAPDLKKAYTS